MDLMELSIIVSQVRERVEPNAGVLNTTHAQFMQNAADGCTVAATSQISCNGNAVLRAWVQLPRFAVMECASEHTSVRKSQCLPAYSIVYYWYAIYTQILYIMQENTALRDCMLPHLSNVHVYACNRHAVAAFAAADGGAQLDQF